MTGEPDFLIPNSYENIASILRNIGEHFGISRYGIDKHWLYLECDGGIYTIVDKLIFNVLWCGCCKNSFYGKENYLSHQCQGSDEPEFEFDWLVLMPGLLHLEMNSGKAFMKLNWEVCMKRIVMALGFMSPKYIHKGSDHHKMWWVLEILYIAAAEVLLVPYVRDVHSTEEASIPPSYEGYWEWCKANVDPNYNYLIFTFLHGMMLFRCGVRRGNAEAILSGENRFLPILFAGPHPHNQSIVA